MDMHDGGYYLELNMAELNGETQFQGTETEEQLLERHKHELKQLRGMHPEFCYMLYQACQLRRFSWEQKHGPVKLRSKLKSKIIYVSLCQKRDQNG